MADLASLYIKVDSKGVVTASKDLDNLTRKSKDAEKATESVTRSFSKLQAAVVALASSYAFLKMAQYIKDTALLAARYETLGVVMRVVGNNAGYSGAQMDEFARGLQNTGIAMVESRNTLARMIQAQIDLTNSQKLARIAQDAAVIGAMNSSEAFEHMIYGLQTGHPRILRTIGLNVDFDKSVRALADSLGIKKDALSEAQIMQGRVNAVMKAGVLITGTYEAAMTTAGKKIASFTRYVQDFKVKMGKAFGPATVILVDAATAAMKEMQEEISKPEAQEALRNLSTQLATTITQLGEDLPKAIEKTTSAIANIHALYNSLPEGVIGATGAGLIGRILFGGWGPAKAIAAMFLINTQMEQFNTEIWEGVEVKWGLSAITDSYWDAVDALQKIQDEMAGRTIKGVPVEPLVKTFKITDRPEVELPPKVKPPPEEGLSKLQIKNMQELEMFAIKMSAAEQERLNERYELEQEINAKIHDELLSDTAFRLQELDSQFLAADSFIKDKAMLDEWYVKQYEEIVGTQEQAYMDLYNNFGILTQEAYDQIYGTYVKDRDDFIALTGNKETAHQVFAERLTALNEEMEGIPRERLDAQKDFNAQYAAMGKSTFDVEREQLTQQAESWKKYGFDKEKIAKLTSDKLKKINEAETKQRINNIQSVASSMADGFKMISEMGGKHSKEAFAMYKAFKITETIISTYSGAMKAYEALASIPYVGPALGVAAAAAVTAFGMAQVSAINSAQPPSYDLGGISEAKGIYQTGDIAEAHIPIPSGGKIPVEMKSDNQISPKPMIVNIHEAPGTQTRVEQSEDGQNLEIIIEQVEQAMTGRMERGTGMAPFMDGRYGRAY